MKPLSIHGGSVTLEEWQNAHLDHDGPDLRLTLTNGSVGFNTDHVERDFCRDDLLKIHQFIGRILSRTEVKP